VLKHFRAPAAAPEIALTPRESEVLGCLGKGLSIRETATKLSLSEHTAGDHVKSIYRKLNISTRAEAALEALKRKLV
jgi:DNA-binding NarL/FixJ family response regulator